MQQGVSKRSTGRKFQLIRHLLPPLAVTAFLWLTSTNSLTTIQIVIALSMLVIPWIAFARWRQTKEHQLPLIAMVTAMYWIYFGVGLFWGELAWQGRGAVTPQPVVTTVMVMALLGVVSMLLGFKAGSAIIRIRPSSMGDPRTNFHWLYIDSILVVRILATRYLQAGVGGEIHQIMIVLAEALPLVAFILLFQKYLDGGASGYEKLLLMVFLGAKILTGLASGWMGGVVVFFIILVALYVKSRGSLPAIYIAVLVVYILFFQVGKEEFRRRYWYSGNSASTVEKLTEWVSLSIQRWQAMYEHPSQEQFHYLAAASISRVSLVPLVAMVAQRTPEVVPYQHGKLYSYMLITLIPRFIWPEKPTFNEANQFFQLSYGFARARDLEYTSMAVGIMAEAYINFGWPGIVGMMFLMGVFLQAFQSFFLARTSPAVLSAIGISLLPALLSVESQLVQYFGGMIQQVATVYVVFLPITSIRRKLVRAPQAHPSSMAIPTR